MHLELNKIIAFLQNKKILIAGFGKEGQSTYSFLLKHVNPKNIFIADKKKNVFENISNNILADSIFQGETYLNSANDFDLIIKSPGIPMFSFSDKLINYEKITSQTELFLKFFKKRVIGITGTKGKSTSSSLIHHILNSYWNNSILAGNIGSPIFDYLEKNHDGYFILELSSHQLENCRYSPHIAVLLNIFPEHLDHYKSFADNSHAKWQIALNQEQGDFLIIPEDYLETEHTLLEKYRGELITFSREKPRTEGNISVGINEDTLFFKDKSTEQVFHLNKDKISLKGSHNRLNIAAAFLASYKAGVPENKIIQSLLSFKPLPHRLEFLGEYKSISFYNDSIATIPEATIAALEAIPETDSIILGGFNRGITYDKLIKYIISSNISNLILMGEVGQLIKKAINKQVHNKRILDASDITEAVIYAYKYTKSGQVCLLSPAASSYDQFKNFEDKGDKYKAAILKNNI